MLMMMMMMMMLMTNKLHHHLCHLVIRVETFTDIGHYLSVPTSSWGKNGGRDSHIKVTEVIVVTC